MINFSWFTFPHEREEQSFIHKKIFTTATLTEDGEVIISQLFGFYSLINCVIVAQASLFCHYRPVLFTAGITLVLKALFLLSQGYIYRTIPTTSVLQVPLLISCLALAGVVSIPYILNENRYVPGLGSENEDLLKTLKLPKKRKQL